MSVQQRAVTLLSSRFRAEDGRLSLSCMDIDKDLLSEIVKHDISKVKTLDVYGNQMGDEGAQVFINACWQTLWMVYLGANKLSGINLNGFKANNFPTLQILDISENNIGNKGIELLVKSQIPTLAVLVCQQCGIGSEGAKRLTKSNWPKLQTIDLTNNNIGNGLSYLSLNNWPKLKELILMATDQTAINALNLVNSTFKLMQYVLLQRNQLIQTKTLVKIITSFALKEQQLEVSIE